jgi:hypothetical protein
VTNYEWIAVVLILGVLVLAARWAIKRWLDCVGRDCLVISKSLSAANSKNRKKAMTAAKMPVMNPKANQRTVLIFKLVGSQASSNHCNDVALVTNRGDQSGWEFSNSASKRNSLRG